MHCVHQPFIVGKKKKKKNETIQYPLMDVNKVKIYIYTMEYYLALQD